MDNSGEFVYILYPVPIEKARTLGLGFVQKKDAEVLTDEKEGFMPLWYGNACFPEDEI